MLRVLVDSRDFRARTRAALALGASADPRVAPALANALRDPEATVRAAAAAGLGRLGNPEVLPQLRAALSDASREVRDAAQGAIAMLNNVASRGSSSVAGAAAIGPPVGARPLDWGSVRYVVFLGQMLNRSGFGQERLQQALSREVHRNLNGMTGIAAMQEAAAPTDAHREIERRRLPRLRLEGNLSSVRREARGRDVSVRCEVSLVLMDEPGRNLRAALTGAATGSGRATQELSLAEQALAGAVRSAMSGAQRAISGSAR